MARWSKKGGHAEIRPVYYADRGMTREFAAAALRWFNVQWVDLLTYPTLENQDALVERAHSAAGSAKAGNDDADENASVVHVSIAWDDEDEDWNLADAVGLDQVGTPVGV